MFQLSFYNKAVEMLTYNNTFLLTCVYGYFVLVLTLFLLNSRRDGKGIELKIKINLNRV